MVDTEQWGADERHAGSHGRQCQVKALDRRLRARCCVDHHPERIVQLRETNLEVDPASQQRGQRGVEAATQ